jgi:hypothetical protein
LSIDDFEVIERVRESTIDNQQSPTNRPSKIVKIKKSWFGLRPHQLCAIEHGVPRADGDRIADDLNRQKTSQNQRHQ